MCMAGVIEVPWQIKQLPQKVRLASAISWYFLSHQLWNILVKHSLLTDHGQWHHAGRVLQEPNLYDLFPWRRNCGSVFSLVGVMPLQISDPSLQEVQRAWKPTLLSVGGVAREGRVTGRNLKLQYTQRLAQCKNSVYRWWVNLMGGEACRGLFYPFFFHSHFQNSDF